MTVTTLSVQQEGAVAWVTLCRPEALNTMTAAFWTDIVTVFEALAQQPAVRCIVLASTGRHFSAGLDLDMAQKMLSPPPGDAARMRERFRRTIRSMQDSFSTIARSPVPVIAVVQGGCIGGGVDLVSACDIRIGTAGCFFSIHEINIGIVADVGTLQRLPQLIPQGVLRELAYTGRRFSSAEAVQHGLLNSAHPTHEAALAAAKSMAEEIAAKSPMAIVGTKHILDAGQGQTIEEGLDYVATWNAGMLLGEDLAEAMRAQQEKRAAAFQNLLA